jgi:hypothetical protein
MRRSCRDGLRMLWPSVAFFAPGDRPGRSIHGQAGGLRAELPWGGTTLEALARPGCPFLVFPLARETSAPILRTLIRRSVKRKGG